MKKGQTLVILLMFIAIAIAVTTAAVMISISGSLAAFKLEQGTVAYHLSENGAENALMQLLRNPFYSGETLTTEAGTTTITVTGDNPKVIISRGRAGDFLRSVRITVNYTGGIMTVASWREIN
jgi:hypothetical protein